MCLRWGGRLRGSGRIGSGRPRSCRSHRPRRVPSRGSRGRGPGPGAPPPEPRLRGVGLPAGRRVTDAVPESRPRGSRFGDVTWARIVPGGIARIERRWISSRWARMAARMARGGVDSVELTWDYASRTRPAPDPAAPGLVREPARGRRGPGPAPRPIPSRSGRPASTYPWQTFSWVTRRSRGPDGVPLADPDSPDGEDDDEPMARTDSGPARTEWLTSPTARTARRRLRGRGAALLAGHGQRAEEGVHRAAPSLYWRAAPPFTGA